MSKHERFRSQRARAIAGGSVAAVALAVAGVLGGVGFPKSSVTAAQAQYGKIVICHKTHSLKNPSRTISISLSAWPAHLRHGDKTGACTTTTTTTGTTTTTPTTTTTATTTTASATSAPGKSGEHGKSQGRGRRK